MLNLRSAVAVAALLCVSCASAPYKGLATGYNAVGAAKRLGEAFDGSVKRFLEAKRIECKLLHKIKTAEYDKCVLPAVRLSRAWTGEKAGVKAGKGALPILQAAQKATKRALDAAYDYVQSHELACSGKSPSKKCHGDWKVLLKPGLCAAWTVVDAGVKLGAYRTTSDPTYKLVAAVVDAFACGR
jgi:hypothetical protein